LVLTEQQEDRFQPLVAMSQLELSHFPQPEFNEADSVQAALDALSHAKDESSSHEAHEAFLWAVGNSHAGTYHPIILGVLPEIEKILVGGNAWAQRAAIESLIDLGGSFVPEPGYETYLGGPVQEKLTAFIHSMRRQIELLTKGRETCASSAKELLDLINDQML
jgi:hypothetical protein